MAVPLTVTGEGDGTAAEHLPVVGDGQHPDALRPQIDSHPHVPVATIRHRLPLSGGRLVNCLQEIPQRVISRRFSHTHYDFDRTGRPGSTAFEIPCITWWGTLLEQLIHGLTRSRPW